MATAKKQRATPADAAVCGEDDLALYWDSRYNRYFIAGAMTPPTGQLYDMAGTAITRPSDTHTWSCVELEQGECPAGSGARSSSRSIICRRDKQGWSKRPRMKRRISWSTLSAPYSEVVGAEQTKDQNGGTIFFTLYTIICLTIVFVLVLLVLFWLWAFTEGGPYITVESTMGSEISTEAALVVRKFIRRRVQTTPPRPIIANVDFRGRQLQDSTNDSFAGADLLTPLPK